MTEQWQELKETITELRDNDGTGTQQEVCKFLANLMDVLEKQMQEPKTGHWIEHDSESLREIGYYRCSECNHGYQRYERGVRKSEVPYINGQKYELHRIDNFCPNCGAKMKEGE